MRFLKKIWLIIASIFLAMPAYAEWQVNMSTGVTSVSRDIYLLHMTAFWICVGIGVAVFGVMIYSLIMHRKSRGVIAADFHENTTLEITWAIIPFLILIALAVPATLLLIRMTDAKDAALTIQVTGYQWKWEYDYLDYGVHFYSNLSTPLDQLRNRAPKGPNYLLEVDNPVVVPVHKKVRFLVTSHDVIHSWWMPMLGIKQDAIPGFIHETWAEIDRPGTYRGQCAELCGAGHGFMPIVVEAVSESDFNRWIAEHRNTTLPSPKIPIHSGG